MRVDFRSHLATNAPRFSLSSHVSRCSSVSRQDETRAQAEERDHMKKMLPLRLSTFINANTAWHSQSAAIFDRDSIPLLFYTTPAPRRHRFLNSLSFSLFPHLPLSPPPPLSLSLSLSLLCRYLDTCSFSRSYSSSRFITTVAVPVDAQHRSESTLSSLHFLFLLSVLLRRLRRLVSSAIVLFILSDSVYYISSHSNFPTLLMILDDT